MPFKGLLILENDGGHPEWLKTANENVEVVFVPANTSILQALDQGVNRCFKANYIKITFTRIYNFLDEDLNANIMNWRKSLNIADCVNYVKEAIYQIKPHLVNA